jgi:endoglucanase
MKLLFFTSLLFLITSTIYSQNNLKFSDKGYFQMPGLEVTVFADIYPEGHQTGITIIQHGERVVANGDIRLEVSPGQWSPVPKAGKKSIDNVTNTISQELWFPDSIRNRKGFNPIDYPDLILKYRVSVTPIVNSSFKISVDLDNSITEEWVGKVGFNFELFPGSLFGKTYIIDGKTGIFPQQANGPMVENQGQFIAASLGSGKILTIVPENDLQRMQIQTQGKIELYDGRGNHNNGWFIVRELVPSGKTNHAIEWIVTPTVVENWKYQPVIHMSQVGYHPNQAKTILIETDSRDEQINPVKLVQITSEGKKEIKTLPSTKWGNFLRYNYFTADFSDIKTSGMYEITCGNVSSNPFKIDSSVYEHDVWQPVLDYFLPVQMCHTRVVDHYRVWHNACHLDDALMAPINLNHFDGYFQGNSTLTNYKPMEHVPGLNQGGWHDAGDFDLRIESQIGEVYILSSILEEFDLNYDATSIDEEKLLTEIHKPDGKNDVVQQIEHGLKSVLGGYRSMGRLYRGIISPTLEQYVMMGDASTETDNEINKIPVGKTIPDDRMVFTEENPRHECFTGAGLAIASRVLKKSNPNLSAECLKTALEIWENSGKKSPDSDFKVQLIVELLITTRDEKFADELYKMEYFLMERMDRNGWIIGKAKPYLKNEPFLKKVEQAVRTVAENIKTEAQKSPFGVPYKPVIWGAGWSIQKFGVDQYYLHKAWTELISADFYLNALNFILGVHPGKNTASFASGIGSNSVTTAYGLNRADWSYIPGGVVSGTALIRPDLPELKEWPYFWQQTEYVMGGGSTNFMFLVLAADKELNR